MENKQNISDERRTEFAGPEEEGLRMMLFLLSNDQKMLCDPKESGFNLSKLW